MGVLNPDGKKTEIKQKNKSGETNPESAFQQPFCAESVGYLPCALRKGGDNHEEEPLAVGPWTPVT